MSKEEQEFQEFMEEVRSVQNKINETIFDRPNLTKEYLGVHIEPCGYSVLTMAFFPPHNTGKTAWVPNDSLKW